MAPGDDMVHLLGHDRLLVVAVLHGKLVGEHEALFIKLSIEDSSTVHTRLKGETFGVENPMIRVLAPPLGNDSSRDAPRSTLEGSTAFKLKQFISASYMHMAVTDVSLLLSHTLNTFTPGLDIAIPVASERACSHTKQVSRCPAHIPSCPIKSVLTNKVHSTVATAYVEAVSSSADRGTHQGHAVTTRDSFQQCLFATIDGAVYLKDLHIQCISYV